MTKSATLLATFALAASSFAGTAMVGSGKGKAVAPAPAPAPECPCLLSYNYVEAGWVRVDLDNVGDANGGYVDAYYTVANNVFVDASFTKIGGDLESDALTAGIGGYIPVANCVHLLGRAGFSYFDGGDTTEAWYISPGIRAQVGCNLELYAKAYIEFDGGETFESYGVGAVYHFTNNIGLNVGYAFSDDANSIQAGIRYQF